MFKARFPHCVVCSLAYMSAWLHICISNSISYSNWAGSYGALLGQAFSHISALAPLWKSESISRSVLSDSSWPHEHSPPGSSGDGILQARILEWGVIPFSKGYSWPRDQIQVSFTAGRFFTIWTIREAPFSEVPGYQCLIDISRVILQMWKPHTKWKMLTPWWPWVPSLRVSLSLRTDNINTCDTALLPHNQPIRELSRSWSHTLWPTSSTWSLKKLSWNPLGILEIFGGPEPPTSCHSPTRNLSLLQTSTSPFVWPRCTLGIWIWVNSMPGHVPLLPCMNGCKKKPKCLLRYKTHGWNSCLNFYTSECNSSLHLTWSQNISTMEPEKAALIVITLFITYQVLGNIQGL